MWILAFCPFHIRAFSCWQPVNEVGCSLQTRAYSLTGFLSCIPLHTFTQIVAVTLLCLPPWQFHYIGSASTPYHYQPYNNTVYPSSALVWIHTVWPKVYVRLSIKIKRACWTSHSGFILHFLPRLYLEAWQWGFIPNVFNWGLRSGLCKSHSSSSSTTMSDLVFLEVMLRHGWGA